MVSDPDDSAEPGDSCAPSSPPTEAVHASDGDIESEPVLVAETHTFNHDSLVTVRLSEPAAPRINTHVATARQPSRHTFSPNMYSPSGSDSAVESEQPSSATTPIASQPTSGSTRGSYIDSQTTRVESEVINSEADQEGEGDEDVDWEVLEESEDREPKVEDSDNSTVLLLARLEQENNRIATNPKSAKVDSVTQGSERASRSSRPPSMAQLREMAYGPTPPTLRYSMLPPPPMTDLEFYMALVRDYRQTAARLPTLLTHKIRKGVPPPLRGVVWQSMAGARDSALEEIFENLTGESSPYEGLIGKDLGRSFPGVDMFREPDGDGQRMLGRVLKCYSLYDQAIGYCQGLAFLVGPLLMHMPDKQAFCILVRLMESYDLRSCFLPNLAGLHVRIHQFRELLRENLPILSEHLDALQVDPAYVSQWFLSFFAVTSPLPMLFRIYDVIFAEGASETLMRVALALMHKNQGRILACAELEDVMQLLLSRGLWDCYNYNADNFVQDFVGWTNVVTRERLTALEQGYRIAHDATNNSAVSTNANAVRASSSVSAAASRFLGRLWASSSSPSITTAVATVIPTPSRVGGNGTPISLSPALPGQLRPFSMLQRSASKHSVASTFNSMEAGSSSAVSITSSFSTEATTISRDSSGDDSSSGGAPSPTVNSLPKSAGVTPHANANSDSKHLHSQIEDLLTALSELQRNHTLLADQLQKEREERAEDRRAVRLLLDGLRTTTDGLDNEVSPDRRKNDNTPKPSGEFSPDRRRTQDAADEAVATKADIFVLLDAVEQRLGSEGDNRRSSVPQTKVQLRDELARARELLSNETSKNQAQARRVVELDEEVLTLKDQLRESHIRARNLHQDKQRMEKQMQTMRGRASAGSALLPETDGVDWFGRAGLAGLTSLTGLAAGGPAPASSGAAGLRELKLVRSRSTPSQSVSPALNGRTDSLGVKPNGLQGGRTSTPSADHDALVLELVQAKTAEATARQEAEEVRQKLESLRRAFGLSVGDTPPASTSAGAPNSSPTPAASAAAAINSTTASAASAAMGMLGRFTASVAETAAAARATSPNSGTTVASAAAGLWGWRRG